jgi:hypothetical protein
MTECIGKSGPGLDFENQLRKIEARHPGIDRAAQGNQALRFLQFVERRENQVGVAANFFDPYARIFGQVGGFVPEGLVEPLAEALQFLVYLARYPSVRQTAGRAASHAAPSSNPLRGSL